jgi:hypothetical protein
MRRTSRKAGHLLRRGPTGLMWLAYMLGVAPWAHMVSRFGEAFLATPDALRTLGMGAEYGQ